MSLVSSSLKSLASSLTLSSNQQVIASPLNPMTLPP